MFSLLANANYEYKEMKLADLRNRIIKENQLTPLDILKGFHTKSNIRPKYIFTQTEIDNKIIDEINAAVLEYAKTTSKPLAQKLYDEIFNEWFDKLLAVEPNATIEKVNNGEYKSGKIGDLSQKYSCTVRNAVFNLSHHMTHNSSVEETVEEDLNKFINIWLSKHYPDYVIVARRSKIKELPEYIELNCNEAINFDEIYMLLNSSYGGIFGGLTSASISVDSHLVSVNKSFTIHIGNLYRHLSRKEAETIFNNAIDEIIYNNNQMGTLAYFQNLEAQPITINMNTKTRRVELIDGYKRLLYIANQTLLDYSAPIRVFTDLDDIGFLSLLYAANLWKYTAKTRDIAFHDRGYLFALKTRYGFEIPEIAYKHYSDIKDYSDILAVFYTYDFDSDYYKYKFNDDQMSIMDALRHHKHTIKDLIIILNILPQESSRDLQYDKNIADEIENFIIRTLGHIRRLPNSDDQKDLNPAVITKIFNDELIIKECSKKHLSTPTYVKNHLENKNLYNKIIEILLNSLT